MAVISKSFSTCYEYLSFVLTLQQIFPIISSIFETSFPFITPVLIDVYRERQLSSLGKIYLLPIVFVLLSESNLDLLGYFTALVIKVAQRINSMYVYDGSNYQLHTNIFVKIGHKTCALIYWTALGICCVRGCQ